MSTGELMKQLLITLGALSLLLCGCQGMETEKVVTIGVIMPQTGGFAVYGSKVIRGMKYFVQQYNADHAVKIELLVKDNRSTPGGTITAFNQLARYDKVPLVIGAYASSNSAVLKPFARRYKIPVITPTSTSDVVTENNPYMFRTCFSDSSQGEALGKFTKQRLKINRVGILIDIDEDAEYSKGLARSFAKSYKSVGGNVVIKVGYSQKDTENFPKLLHKIIAAKVDAIFAPTYLEEATKIIKAARKYNFKGYVFGGDGWDEDELLTSSGPHLNRCFFSTMFSPFYNTPVVKKFVQEYARTHSGAIPGLCIAQGYDTIKLVASLIEQGKLTNIKKRLGQVEDFPGVTGNITIKPDGNAIKTVFVERVNRLKTGEFKAELVDVIPPTE
jgi:branched-chain amino acid transport system substrate-binding protein